MQFEWDERKNKTNIKKHGISFQEAATVFDDPHAMIFSDPDHSVTEDRFLIIGITTNSGLCIVSHCYRNEEQTVRIISARKADQTERYIYLRYLGGGKN